MQIQHGSHTHRLAIAQSFDQWIMEESVDREMYYLNFMFNSLPGSVSTKMDIMIGEVRRVHGLLGQHIGRRLDRPAEAWLKPTFVGCHDYPVHKKDKANRLYQPTVNDGLHFNVVEFERVDVVLVPIR